MAEFIIFSWINAQNILFQLPNLKNYIVWESKWLLLTRWQKMLKMNHQGLYTLHDLLHSMPQLLQSVIKKRDKKRAMSVIELLNTCAR